jgi:hypothetical protein
LNIAAAAAAAAAAALDDIIRGAGKQGTGQETGQALGTSHDAATVIRICLVRALAEQQLSGSGGGSSNSSRPDNILITIVCEGGGGAVHRALVILAEDKEGTMDVYIPSFVTEESRPDLSNQDPTRSTIMGYSLGIICFFDSFSRASFLLF